MTALIHPSITCITTAATAYACSTLAKAPNRPAMTSWICVTSLVTKWGDEYFMPKFFPASKSRSCMREQVEHICEITWIILASVALHRLSTKMKLKLPPFFTTLGIYGFTIAGADILQHTFRLWQLRQKKQTKEKNQEQVEEVNLDHLNENTIKAAYRFPADYQENHHKNVIVQVSQSKETVLFIQGDCTLDSLSKTHGQKYWLHTTLAMSWADQGTSEILGLVKQTLSTQTEEKNSFTNLDSPLNHHQWIYVGIECRDIYNHFLKAKKTSWHTVVKTGQDESVIVNGKTEKLNTWINQLKSENCELELRLAEHNPTKTDLKISWGKAEPLIPSEATERTLLTYISASKSNNPKLDWTLVTNMQVNNRQEAEKILKIYDQQWVIKHYFICVRAGYEVENDQLQSEKHLSALHGTLGTAAAELLKLNTTIATTEANGDLFPINKKKIIISKFNLPEDCSADTIWEKIALMGGNKQNPSKSWPSWHTIWRGWLRLQDIDNASNTPSTTSEDDSES